MSGQIGLAAVNLKNCDGKHLGRADLLLNFKTTPPAVIGRRIGAECGIKNPSKACTAVC